MWLRRFIRTARHLLSGAILVTTFGCASSPGPKPAEPTRAAAAAMSAQPPAEIPPQAQTLFEQAVAVMAAGDDLEAQFRFEEFVLQYPNFPGAYTNLAIIHAQSGDDEAAEGRITDALIIAPQHAPTLNQLGMLLRRQGKFKEAESAYLKAVGSNPDYALAHYNLGVLYELYLRQLDSALAHFEKYQSLIGDDKQVEKWITDLKRRVAASQRTANVTE